MKVLGQTSSPLAQTPGLDRQLHLLAHDLNEHHHARYAVCHLVNGLQAGKGALVDAQLLTGGKVRLLQGLGLQLGLDGRDQSIVYLGRHIAKADRRLTPVV